MKHVYHYCAEILDPSLPIERAVHLKVDGILTTDNKIMSMEAYEKLKSPIRDKVSVSSFFNVCITSLSYLGKDYSDGKLKPQKM
jgi:hypothetical protein